MMKKRLIACIAAALLVGGVLAGCGSSAETDTNDAEVSSEIVVSETVSSEETSEAPEESGMTLEDYVNSSDWQEQQKAMNEQIKSQGMSMEITAVKNDMTLTMKFLDQQDITDEIKEMLQSEAFLAQFETLVNEQIIPSMEQLTSVGVVNPTVTIRMVNADDSEIFSKTVE